MTSPRVLIIAVGDSSDGDSGLAPALLRALRAQPVAKSWWLTLVTDAEFQIDHAIELRNSDLALFVHSGQGLGGAYVFREVGSADSQRAIELGESLGPAGVLHTLSTVGRRATLPPSFELTLDAESFSGREGLSAAATSNLNTALEFVERLLEEPDADRWRQELSG